MSRQPRAGVPSGSLTIRVTKDERAAWEARSGRIGKLVSEWLRDLANRDVSRSSPPDRSSSSKKTRSRR